MATPAADPRLGQVEALLGRGRRAEAEALCRQILARQPADPGANFHLAMLAMTAGRPAEALAPMRIAAAAQPERGDLALNLGAIHHQLGQLDEAVACYRRAAGLMPGMAMVQANLGHALKALGRLDEAEACCERAVALAPDDPFAHLHLGGLRLETGRFAEAGESYRRAIALRPDFAQAHLNLGVVESKLGRQDAALAAFREALRLQPDNLNAASNVVYVGNYRPDADARSVLADAQAFGALVAARARPPGAWPNRPDPERRLRVGFVSGDLREHPVGFFLESLLAALDRGAIEPVAYATDARQDASSARLRASFALWRSAVGLSDEALAGQVAADGVDILIDLAGHTAGNRLGAFAWKPAPVQASWLGYVGTTGVAAIDYVIGDRFATPPDEDAHFSERVWRLPDGYMCFTPPAFDLPVGELPAGADGPVTFGSFNNLAKLNERVIACWAGALAAVPGSRLLLRAPQLSQAAEVARLHAAFVARGVDPARLLLEPPRPTRREGMAQYARVDIALDPFPYTGVTTSVEAMYMGVPVLTRRGDRFLSHVGESLNRILGLDDWIAADDADFAGRARALAADRDALGRLRAGLRDRLLASPLCDAPRFAHGFEQALRGMWRDWCRRSAGA